MKDSTSKKHYKKYHDLCKKLGFVANAKLFTKDLNDLKTKFQNDPNLNDIPLDKIDCWSYSFYIFNRCSGLSTAELCCMAKHSLIYDVLKCEPVFED